MAAAALEVSAPGDDDQLPASIVLGGGADGPPPRGVPDGASAKTLNHGEQRVCVSTMRSQAGRQLKLKGRGFGGRKVNRVMNGACRDNVLVSEASCRRTPSPILGKRAKPALRRHGISDDTRRSDAGFSFVELLITIVIAGIAFAAMVPLFVQAQETNSADKVRNTALQVAQDKIEKVRQLDYDQLTQGNLESATFAGGQFGTTWDFVRAGKTRTYTIQYTVSQVPVGAPAGQEQYKKVEVRVTWSAPPSPVKAAVLQTLVYRQYAGPEIQSVTVGPPSVFDLTDPDGRTIVGSPVVIDVVISPEDITSMNASDPDPTKRGWVKFTVSPYTGGGPVAAEEVRTIYNNLPGHYRYVWDNSAAADGIYKFEMTAVSAKSMQGSTATSQFSSHC